LKYISKKFLNIKGLLLDNIQLEKYIEKIAMDYEVQRESQIDTFPLDRLKDNYKFIEKTYYMLQDHIKKNIDIYPAAEWLLDNFYIIDECVKKILKNLNLIEYKKLPGISNGMYKGFSRIYLLSALTVAYSDGNISEELIKNILDAYQKKKTIQMEEMWKIPVFIEICLIENIRDVCEKIYNSHMQKFKVESIIERIIEKKNINNQEYKTNSIKNLKIQYSNIKYPFIEYMSYRLKQLGKLGNPYLNILEQEINKTGTTVSETISKEHFDIAIQKVLIGNAITGIRTTEGINFLNLFETTNEVEEILNKDPANVYYNMDFLTKIQYRNKIKEIADKTKYSEVYIAKTILQLAENKENIGKEKHVGYYLIGNGEKIVNQKFNIKSRKPSKRKYINSLKIITILLTLIFTLLIYKTTNDLGKSIFLGLLTLIPASEICIQIINYILNKVTKQKIIPKMNYYDGIPEKAKTIVIIPTIIKDSKKVEEMMQNLEVYYLANKSKNLEFALLGDCTSSENEKEPEDEILIAKGIEEAKRLNKEHGQEIFHFLYRDRIWNQSENCYMGWERKRGLICQFNKFIVTGENGFKTNTLVGKDTNFKYAITLDADTNLILNSAFELVGAMDHILNEPVVNNNVVTDGYGIIQPRVGIDLEASKKSLFTKIYSGAGGVDLYANALSDVYQDNFGEGIFTGKGIYNIEVFYNVLTNEIPENLVLSHDLLEGSYLRCGLATDILLLDGTPFKYNSFLARMHRWIRGDWQIIQWLKKYINQKNLNPLNTLSKFKILDNLRRSLVPILSFFILGLGFILKLNILVYIALISYSMPTIIDFLNYIIFRKNIDPNYISARKNMVPVISGIKASFYRGILEIIFLPTKAYYSANAIIKTLYRLTVSKKHLLEWMTSEEAEKQMKTSIGAYYRNMLVNVVLGTLGIIYSVIAENYILSILAISWIIAPYLSYIISKEYRPKKAINYINNKDKEYIREIAKQTWKYFEDHINQENNFLPPDNYQEDRKEKQAHRTSPTNIGLSLLVVASAYDLQFITLDETINLLEKMINTICKLQTWNGHLYNWYNTKTLDLLYPRYVSTVDSGNFVGYLYTLKQFLYEVEKNNKNEEVLSKIRYMVEIIKTIIDKTDFKVLFDDKKQLFSIGANIEEGKLTNSYYDLLASEARQASLIAIAKRDVSSKHWRKLSRTLTTLYRYKGLISWSGTAFEYLMPNINIKTYEGSLLDESCRFLIMSQQEYAKKLDIPWGISEAAYSLKDFNNNYQYKAFGIPWLGLKRGLEQDMVVSPYSVFLSLSYYPEQAVKNLKELDKQEMVGKYGFYESIDYTVSRLKYGRNYEPVKTFMAHHQGLIMLSITNFLKDNILVNRFHKNPEIKSVDILLQERMPEKAIITKEKKEKIVKAELKNNDNYFEETFKNNKKTIGTKANVLSNGEYSICITKEGSGFSKYGNILVNRYKETADYNQGIFFYIKNLKNKKIWNTVPLNNEDGRTTITMSPNITMFKINEGNIETTTKVTVSPEDNVEIRRLELINKGIESEILEVTTYFEPVLTKANQDYAHMAFNDLFLSFEAQENNLIIKRNKRNHRKEELYATVKMNVDGESIGDFEYEIDKERFFGKGNIEIPELIVNSKPMSKHKGNVTEPIVAIKRTIKIEPQEKATIDFLICVGKEKQQTIELANKYSNTNFISNVFEISKAKSQAEISYLELNSKQIAVYQKILSYLMFSNPLKETGKYLNKTYLQQDLWKYGISGDIPILLVKIKDINDIKIIYEVLKAYEYIKLKNFSFDIVFLNQEQNSYENYIKYELESILQHRQKYIYTNNSGNIYTIAQKDIPKEDLELLHVKASIILDASLGSISTQLQDLEEEYQKTQINPPNEKMIILNKEKENLSQEQELLYENGYGGFSTDGHEYIFKINKENKLPIVWSNILANPDFGTLITQNLGGFTWLQNSRLNRITAWNNMPSIDIPSEIIYFKDNDTNEYWTLSENLTNSNQDYIIKYGFGYVYEKTLKNEIMHETEVFVPLNDKIKVNLIKLRNTSAKTKKLKLLYYIKPVMGEDEILSNGYIKIAKENNIVMAKKVFANEFSNNILYVSSNENIVSYTNNKSKFIGKGNIKNPDAIGKKSLDNETKIAENSCVAIEINLELQPFENKEVCLLLGMDREKIEVKDLVFKYSKIEKCKEELNKVKKYWYEMLTKIQVKTPIDSINIMLNGWAIYQTISSRLWGRTGYYQSGGAFGFRDQLQDTLGVKYIDEKLMRNQILKHASHQFIEGDVQHWWHEETKRGIRTRFSDDLLWMCYTVSDYLEYSGDYKILEEDIDYLQGAELENGVDERYDEFLPANKPESLYNHCIKAIERSLNFGENGLPKIGSGDWNDGLNTVGNKNKGESIWLGFFIYDVLNKFIPICKLMNEQERANKYEEIKEKLKKALNTSGWDGRWFKRAYMDNGEPLRKYRKRRM